MKFGKKILACILTFSIVFSFCIFPTTKVKAYTFSIGSLTVQDYYRKWATAATTSAGVVYVSLSISTYNQVTHSYSGDGTGGAGYITVSKTLNTDSSSVIMSASSTHNDEYIGVYGSWYLDYLGNGQYYFYYM